MRCFKLTLAYDGTAYAGWQVQPDRETVQSIVEAAVERITDHRVRVLAAGRTDAGVHALGQVIRLKVETRLPPDVLCRALNANLPDDVAVLQAEEVDEAFHPIRDAVRKHYRYFIHDGAIRDVFQRQYCWHYRHGRLDDRAMGRAAELLLGTHDFQSFQSSGAERESTVRTVLQLNVRRDGAGQGRAAQANAGQRGAGQGGAIVIDAQADGFLYNMVRNIVGTLVEVGRGARPEDWPAEVLRAADRSAAGPTAPPQGLFLVQVSYEPRTSPSK